MNILLFGVKLMKRNTIYIIEEDGLVIKEVIADETIHGSRNGYIR